MRRARRLFFVALGGLGVVLVAAIVAWVVDNRAHEGKVLRNIKVAGRSVGGLDQRQLAAAVDAISAKFATSTVAVKTPEGGFTAASPELGLRIDSSATVRAAMRTGRTGSLPRRFVGWAESLTGARSAPLQVSVDAVAVRRVVAERDVGPRTPPVEPTVKAKAGGGGFTVEDGKKGKGIDPADLIGALPKAAAAGTEIVVHVDRREIAPQYSKADAEALVKKAETATKKAVPVAAGTATATVPVATLRSWVHSEATPAGLHLVLDQKKTLADLGRILARAATPATETTFVIAGGVPQPKIGSPGSACCADDAVRMLQTAVLDAPAPPTSAVKLPMKTVPPKVAAADVAKLGIKQQVSAFTTNYPAGQPRVTNIHLIADIVKGQIILPGETFSVNGFVGQRTTAKGFVVDHQINDEGKFDEAVGGGVSQFATTTFNAAFFAGLDFGEYQSHSIYISRYPFGREATISWQHPDLQLKNTTPYGVVVWATYTDTSLTVSMWSTPFLASVTQSAQTTAPFGPGCTRVKTERTRKYLDGRTVVDNVFATYQPSEGVKCR